MTDAASRTAIEIAREWDKALHDGPHDHETVIIARALIAAEERVARMEREISALRSAVIHVADDYNSHYDRRTFVRAYRAVANWLGAPFSLGNVERVAGGANVLDLQESNDEE